MLAMGVMPFAGTIMPVSAQNTDTIRYVHPNGAYDNNGLSWETPFNRVQDAINSLHDYLNQHNLHSGSVYIAAGTYVPTESTESAGGSMLNTSFKIYAGIHVYGGFNPDEPEAKPGDRIMSNGKKCSENWADQSGIGTVSGTEIASQWDFQYKTILTGNHSSTPPTFVFDSIRGKYTTAYAASSYHVVWFATNGIWPTTDDQLKNHYKPLDYPASIDGCVISSGNASSRNINLREHTGYGGGVYMVGKTSMRGCIVERCSANMRGGGIYADGGGTIEFCLIQACQSAGIGVYQGYGGGVCIDHEGSVGHCQITSCAARCGGGIFISHVPEDYPTTNVPAINNISNYSPHATACVVNNNTTNAEGAGIYLAEGGTVNHCTVTANNCSGPDVTYYGRRHGRTGGIYVRNCGMIFNSVFWGNRCDVNNDIQFASVRQKTGVAGYETFVYHTAFMNHDITDWTGVRKEAVYSLDKHNMPVEGGSDNFPCFFSPTVVPLKWDSVNTSAGIYGAGVLAHMRPVDYPGPRIWHLTSHSYLDQKGVQWSPAMVDPPTWLIHAHTDYGVVSNPYEPASTLGALVRKPDNMRHALIAPQGLEGRKNATPTIPTIFVDLHHEGDFDGDGHFVTPPYSGHSWEAPLHSIGDALMYYRTYLVETPGNAIGSRAHYHLPSAWNEDGNPTAYTDYDYVQLLVKEGEQSTAGPNNFLGKDMRTASIRTLSHMRLYGGYPDTLSGTNTEGRDPLNHPTIITANIADEKGVTAYANNSAHVLTYVNTEYTIVDGFQLLNGNAHNLTGSAVMAGGGVLVSNDKNVITDPFKRIDMVGNELRNCRLANNSAPKGAAIYVTGDSRNSVNGLCYAELKVVNCIIRNNTADYASGNNGVITANGRAFIDIDHCDIVNNVGYPLQSDNRWWKYGTPLPENGHIRIDNSLIYCNGTEVLNDRSALAANTPLSVNPEGQEYVFGTYNMFDTDIQLHTADATQPHGFFKSDFVVPGMLWGLPAGMPDAANHPLNLAMPAEKYNQCNLTRTDRNASTYPVFINPARNIGHSVEGDRPLYGGKVSFIPLNNNPCVNAASVSAYGANNVPRPEAEDFDLTDYTRRNYGGEPDIGALEDTDLPISGSVIYVTPNGAGLRDGSSWSNAIAGNTVYRLYGAPAAEGDSIDAASNARVINKSSGDPVLTTDNRYCGGFAQSYFTNKTTGGTSTTTVSKTWTTETNVYDNGARQGETETLQDHVERETTRSTLTPGSSEPGFVAGWKDDERFPYGEISGQSRGFWRATGNSSVVDENGSWLPGYTGTKNRNGVVNVDSIAKATATGQPIALVITNERRENYVSGLQWAVEEAARRNHVATRIPGEAYDTLVQVWVGAGKYTDYKGYIMRDSVTVLGGFPATKYQSPGMNERQALMSNVVEIPQANTKLNPVDYETILQVSDINPRTDYKTFNDNAKFFSDDDLAVNTVTDTRSYEYLNVNIVHHYRDTTIVTRRTDSTTSCIQYANMTGSVAAQNIARSDSVYEGIINGLHYYRFGNINGNLDCWHMSYPDKTNYLAFIESDTKNDNTKKTTYDPVTKNELSSSKQNWIMIANGSLTGLTLWQTMHNVPEGTYTVTFDLGGQYKNKVIANDILNIFVCIEDGAGNGLSDTISLKSYSNNKGTNRTVAYRFALNFTQNTDGGDAVFKLFVGVGNKNTKKNNSTYGTPTGEDPDEIPCSYVWDGNGCTGNQWGSKNPNAREFWISNLHLYPTTITTGYDLVRTDSTAVDNTSVPHQTYEVTTTTSYSATKSRTTLRKRVLQMPDVCNPMFAYLLGDASGKTGKFQLENNIEHVERVNKPTRKSRGSDQIAVNDPNYKEYDAVYWDGFTIRHGFLFDQTSVHAGGAGVSMYEGAHLINCIITDNIAVAAKQKGGGFFCDGSNSTVESCFILNNSTAQTRTEGVKLDQTQLFAGGMFLYNGTCFNSLIANNYAHGYGGGLGLCVGNFYNNTVAYNVGGMQIPQAGSNRTEDVGKTVGGVRIATGSTPAILMANTILYGNSGLAVDITAGGSVTPAPFMNCYVHSMDSITRGEFLHAINSHTKNGDKNYGADNILLNGVAPSETNTPFAADVEAGEYTGGAKTHNDFALRMTDSLNCVNKGTEDFEGVMDYCLSISGHGISAANQAAFRQMVHGVELPPNDVVYAKRVQDCQVDIGAYEFNAAYSIKPDTTTHPGQAIFYVTFNAHGGDASANSPANAACKQKLQLVLDAAGRYKYNLMTLAMYNKGEAGTYVADQPNKHWNVEVWLEGDNTNCTVSGEYNDWYTATRSTKHNIDNYIDNTLDYSFIIPHGIQVKGGYTTDFTGRDPLTYRTVLSGKITSSTGAEGNTFHVVTFTNDLFTPDETYYTKDEGGLEVPVRNQLATLTDEKDRAVVDGIFIMDGHANSSDDADRIGAAAVVTDYAHIRNCVIQENTAEAYGGGLYLKPFALVSGTIIKNNTAETGGGIYVETPPTTINPDSLARVYASTICENTARLSAGGMWFDNTYVFVNSTALWHNEANDNANISGVFSRTSEDTDYPLSFCAVESRRLEGQGNVELSPTETEGVRWDRQDPFNAILYYPIEMSSTLSRAGMTYNQWYHTMSTFTTLDSIDIAGVSRTQWTGNGSERGFAWGTDTLVTKNNDMIEIGARAINKNFAINVDQKYVMNRLYVMHTDLINSEAARALQDNTNTDSISNMYRQMGSCILNPFHRLGDAFDYVIAARKADSVTYRNRVFEVYIEAGTYYPYHNAYGEQDEVRNNTFLVPEAIYVIGGVDSRPDDHHYGQEGYFDMFTGAAYGDPNRDVDVQIKLPSGATTSYTINAASRDTIRLRDDRHRPMRDNNLNSVIEPWELERQTILSGNAVSGEDFTHVYHVITMHADANHVGPQPLKFRHMNPEFNKDNLRPGIPMLIDPIPMDQPDQFVDELDQSILGRTTEFDGILITGGYANQLNPEDTLRHPYVKKTYFRGGGIFVDGNWTSDFDKPGDVLPNVTEPAKYNIPIVVENCFFTNNMAGNGGGLYSNGGIYMYGCHFTQNYSQGPMTEVDQNFIPWTAGGCIATNAVCDVANTLFDNNEARRGLYPITVSGDEEIPYADARQGFAGVISAATKSYLRVVNCHFMKNKAVAYPAIYNFTPNNEYGVAKEKQFAFNTIFWGNEVFEVDSLNKLDYIVPPSAQTISDFNTRYKGSRKGVFHYDPVEWDKYEKLFHEYDSLYTHYAAEEDTFNVNVTNKLAELRAQGDKLEGLYFCSYRKTYGPTGMKPTQEGYLLDSLEQRHFVDPRKKPVRITKEHDFPVEKYDSLFTYLHGNNNTLINPINTATDGPNFKQPTFIAGIDGYMQNADWLLARMNLTTDQGWGYLKQTVTRGVGYFLTRYTGKTQYATYEAALAAANAALGTDTCKAWSVLPVRGLPIATFDDVQHPPGSIYNWYSKRYGTYMSNVNAPLPIKDQYYMAYSRTTSDDEVSGNMDRISKHPKTGETDVYIDIGIYEYQYVQLDIKGQEIDTMWVATKTKDPIRHDGLTWETPTTDLQTAIDRLMSSHNNHDKYICFLGDDEGGTFSPSNVIDNRRAFIITSNTLEPLLPDSAEADYDYGVNSLTFLGGYSFDVKDAPRNPQEHPTIIEMPNTGTMAQRNQLFVVEDMTRQMVQANWQGEYTSRDSVVIPIVFDGITFINPYSTKEPDPDAYSSLGGQMSKKGGAAIYYRWQRRYEGDGVVYTPNFNMALHPDSALIDRNKVTLPKLTISNCIFMDNGARDGVSQEERSPAVRIDHGGGSSLIVNTLFHSNAGAPVYARTYDILTEENDLFKVPNDVIMVNITSALNDGHIRLDSKDSEVHNSLIWLDDLGNDTTVQLQMGTATPGTYDQWDKTTNRTREGIENRMTNNAVWGCFMQAGKDPWGNDSLVTTNNDIFGGPGFVLPYVTASTSEQRRERSFRLNPSLMTQNMANQAVYRDRVFFRTYPDDGGPERYWRRSNGFKSVSYTMGPTILVNDSDLAAKPRLSGDGMERGAYECLAVLQRVLYVQPTLSAFAAGDGSSWEHPFGQGQLQNAIDAAAVYTYLRQNDPTREDRKAYVFVKGSYDSNVHTEIHARDGVSVYGSLPNSFNDTAIIDPDLKQFTNAECQRFVNYVRASSTGVASPNATPTRINLIHMEGDNFETGFLLDGFVITNPGTKMHESPVILNNEMSTLRNCLITDNTVTDVPVVDVTRGLLYNNLIYNDSASAIVKVGANGLALNNTIVSDNAAVEPMDVTEAVSGAVVNNIALNTTSATIKPFAPYFTDQTPYTVPDYLKENKPLEYQLHEHSAYIHAGTADDELEDVYDTYVADSTIAFRYDRDVLGNPRKIGTGVDMGALETWRVEKNTIREITARTNKVGPESPVDENKFYAFLENYGGNNYPHQGSVVYLMDSSAMSMQYNTLPDFVDLKTGLTPFALRPGYMLLKPGASFYGNGHTVQMNYVAAEKRFKNQRYSMTSFPFNYNVANISVTHYNTSKDSLIILASPFSFSTYQYNGVARSAKDYVFQSENSSLWIPIDTLNRTATDGYLMDFGEDVTDTVLRFTAFAAEQGRYVYQENGDMDKIVPLLRYDNREAGSGAELNFTRLEDMGWNMKGLPWLVSDYRTDTILNEGNFLRQMHIPHVFYRMDNAGAETRGDHVSTFRSWDAGTKLSMGNAFLTQTATRSDTEDIYFHLPLYSFNERVPRPIICLVGARPVADGSPAGSPARNESVTEPTSIMDNLMIIPDSTADKRVEYAYGRDGVKWHMADDVASIYLLDHRFSSQLSLLGAAPTEVDIPLGISIPTQNREPITENREPGTDYTFHLPEPEAFEGYGYVWLIDKQRNRFTNLLEQDYTVSLEPGTCNTRFAVRIGGFPLTDDKGNRQYIVYAFDGTLYVRGLIPGDDLAVYTATGQLLCKTISTGTEFTMPLFHQSGYVVRVNNTAHKVLNY